MRKLHRLGGLAIAAGLVLVGEVLGQVPVTSSAEAVPPGVAVPAPPAGPSFFGGLSSGLSHCQTCWKKSPVRQLLKNGLSPLSAATGGMIGGGHHGTGTAVPPPTAVAAPPPPPPAVKAAAKIKAEAKTLAARRDAVRYLGTLDCHWYPEAEAGLIAALRADRSECVRLEAAIALQRQCCCTKKTMAALYIAASGSNRDGNPGERCPRVRWAALEALQCCLIHCNSDGFERQAPLQRPETPAQPLGTSEQINETAIVLPEFYRQLDQVPTAELILAGQRTVAMLSPALQPQAEPVAPQSPGSLYAIWASTRAPETSTDAADDLEQRSSPAAVQQLPPVETIGSNDYRSGEQQMRYPEQVIVPISNASPLAQPVSGQRMLTPIGSR